MTSITDIRDVVRSGIASFGGFGGRLIARLGLLVVAGHYFGAAEFGTLGKIAAIIEITSAVGVLGLKRSLLGMLSLEAKAGASVERKIVEAMLVAALVSALLTGVLAMGWPLVFPEAPSMPLILYAAVPSIVLSDVAVTATRFRRIVKWDVLTRCVVEPWTFFVLAVLFISRDVEGGGLVAAYSGSLSAAALCTFVGLISVFGVTNLIAIKPRWHALVSIPLQSAPTGIADIGIVLLRRADILLLGLFAEPAVVGIYYMVQQIVTVPHKVHALFEPMLSPVIARLHHNERPEQIQAKLAGTCRWIFTLQLGISIPLMVLGDQVLAMFGPQFGAGALVLAIILLAELIDGSFALTETPFVYARPRVPPVIVTGALIAECVAVAALASQFGATGAAAGFLITTTGLALARIAALRQLLNIRVLDAAYLRPLGIAVLCASALFLMKEVAADGPPYVMGIAGGGSVLGYLVLVRLLAFPKEDRVVFRRLGLTKSLS